jgi:hypothetical protein
LDTSDSLFEERLDGALVNALTKMGTSQDKEVYTGVAMPEILEPGALDALYLNNWLCRRIVDIVPREATRAGWGLTLGPDMTDAEKTRFDRLVATGERMGIRSQVREAMRLARHQGGAVIVMVLDDNTPLDEPANLTRVRSIKGLHALDCRRIWPAPGWSGVGEPERYQLLVNRDEDMRRAGLTDDLLKVPIHGSRLLRFDGDPVPYNYKSTFRWWGASVLQSVWAVFKRYETGQSSAANILQDFSLFVQKIKGLSAMVAAGNGERISTRLALNAMCRSVIGGIALDSEEDVSFLTRSAAGVDSIIEKLKDEVQGASRIPHTKLWGTSPSGLGADGRSEDASFAQEIHEMQEDHIDRPLRKFYKTLAACSGTDLPEDWKIDFHSTFMLSDQEEADLRQKVAAGDAQWIQAQVLRPNEVALGRFGGPIFSMETTLLDREKDGSIKPQEPGPQEPPTFGGDLALAPGDGQDQAGGPGQAPRGDSSEQRDDGCCSPCDEAAAKGRSGPCAGDKQAHEDDDAMEEEEDSAEPATVGATLHRWKSGGLHSGTGQAGQHRGPVEPDKAHFKQAVAIALSIAGQDRPRKGRGRRPWVRTDGSRITGRRVVAGVTLDVRADGSASLVGPYGEPLSLEAAVGFDSSGLWEVVDPVSGQWTAVVGVEDRASVVAAAGGDGIRVRRLDGLDLIAMGVRCDSYDG